MVAWIKELVKDVALRDQPGREREYRRLPLHEELELHVREILLDVAILVSRNHAGQQAHHEVLLDCPGTRRNRDEPVFQTQVMNRERRFWRRLKGLAHDVVGYCIPVLRVLFHERVHELLISDPLLSPVIE